MGDAEQATAAVAPWRDLVSRAAVELDEAMMGSACGNEAAQAREAVVRAREVLDALARGEEAIKAELPGVRRDTRRHAGRAIGGAHALERITRTAKGASLRDRPPAEALRHARQSRDAVLRLGVWSVLGDWASSGHRGAASTRDLPTLIALHSRTTAVVAPGLAPTPAYADTQDAEAFFNGHLHGVLRSLADEYDGNHASFGRALTQPPMNRTLSLAHLWSGHWSAAVCAVYADWLHRRGDASLPATRSSLWQYSGKNRPVRFRPTGGFAAIPTKGWRLHMDLWLQPVLAQVLAHDPARWGNAALDGRWHAVRLAVHDLGARDVGDLADGPRTLHRGLSVEMLYEALFIDRTTAVIEQHRTEESTMRDSRESSSAQAIDIAFPGCCAGQQLNLRVIVDWRGAKPITGPTRRNGRPLPIALDAEQRRSIRQWRAATMPQRTDHANAAHAAAVDPDQFDWQPAQHRNDDDAIDAKLGHIDLWGSIDASVQWCDFIGMARLNNGWVTLPVNLVDDSIDGRPRTWVTIDTDDPLLLATSGIDTAHIRSRLDRKQDCLWVARRAGLGLFLSLAVDLRPAQA